SLVLEDLSVVNGLIDSSGGGGILTTSDGDLILRRVQVQGNASSGGGGGILNFRGRLELWDSTVSGNESSGNSGGGIFSGGPTRIVNSTVSGNFAAGEGGGILIDRSGSLSLESSTITANSTGPAPPTSIRQSTGLRVLTENIFDNPTTIYQSVISGNGSLGDGVPDCDLPFSDAVNSLGFNYVEESCLGTLGTGDQTGETPQLSGLGDQGGPTPTHLPLTGSPLLDAGDPQCDGTDQRGITRPQDGDGDGNARCDIGAVEFQLPWIFSDRFERRD
ncbi:MAG: choice-of-anchor Q domain-containing protein, partial [Wenzhouxiangella sp.]|nr:choice-of-anchor Q domain-containing protein [Wenzhouxiangella sp.]